MRNIIFKNIKELVGKKIVKITGLQYDSCEVIMSTACGKEYILFHEQDCCENVRLNDFEGDEESLVGGLVVKAEESTNRDKSNRPPDIYDDLSFTWTFYRIDTTRGEIWLRWLGESNGYYSEAVNFGEISK